MERPARERELLRLGLEGIDDPRVAVALVDGAVAREKVVIARAVDVVQVHSLAPFKYDGDRGVAQTRVGLFQFDQP